MKIGLLMNASSSWIGGVVYIQNLVKAIASLPTEERRSVQLYLLTSPDTPVQFYQDLLPLVDGHYPADFLSTRFFHKIRRRIANKIPSLQKQIISNSQTSSIGEEIDFFYPVLGLREVFWNFPSKWAAWIPDFQHKYLPHFFSQEELNDRDIVYYRMAHHASHIIFSSQSALNDFKKFYPTATAQPLILRFHTTVEQSWLETDPKSIQYKYQLPNCFFIVSNQFWQHKNHKILIEALNILKKDSLYPIIVCTGNIQDNRCPGYGEEILQLIEHYQLHKQFVLLGFIPRLEQIQLMRISLAVIQPSLFEGWSTVVEDARALNKTILLSDLEVHREQNPPKSIYFSPDCPEDLAQKIMILMNTLTPNSNYSNENQTLQEQESSQSYARHFLNIADQVCENI